MFISLCMCVGFGEAGRRKGILAVGDLFVYSEYSPLIEDFVPSYGVSF